MRYLLLMFDDASPGPDERPSLGTPLAREGATWIRRREGRDLIGELHGRGPAAFALVDADTLDDLVRMVTAGAGGTRGRIEIHPLANVDSTGSGSSS